MLLTKERGKTLDFLNLLTVMFPLFATAYIFSFRA
jgi:hypothetical protein